MGKLVELCGGSYFINAVSHCNETGVHVFAHGTDSVLKFVGSANRFVGIRITGNVA